MHLGEGTLRRLDERDAVLGVAVRLREAGEEGSVPSDACELLFEAVLDLGYWSYTTVLAPDGKVSTFALRRR